MERTPIPIQRLGGINKNHNRDITQPSNGKNFFTRDGSLNSRPGLLQLPTTFNDPIYAMLSCKQAQLTERLIVQTGGRLHYNIYSGQPWQQGPEISGYAYGNTWREYLIISCGLKVPVFHIESGTFVGDLTNFGAPSCLFTSTWKDYIWTIPGPNMGPAYKLRFNGYEYEPNPEGWEEGDPRKIKDRSILDWPEKHSVSIGDGTSVIAGIPMGGSLLVLTGASMWHLYGNSEDDFQVTQGSTLGAYNPLFNVATMVLDYPLWLSNNRKVYTYTGSVAEHVSGPIDELLEQEFKTIPRPAPRVYTLNNQFWMFMVRNIYNANPLLPTTRAYVFDPKEKEWYIMEFAGHILSACVYDNKIHFGLKDGRIMYMDSTALTDFGNPIKTSFTIGPIEMGSRKIKVKSFHLNAEPRNNFGVDVYATVDDKTELNGPYRAEFKSGNEHQQRIKLSGVKGKTLSLTVETTDRIDELQGGTLVVVPKQVK